MKTSRYNTVFQTTDGTNLAFNAMSGGFATLAPHQYEEARKILDDPDGYPCETEDALQLKEELIKGRFIIGDDVDELKILRVRDNSERFNTDTLSFGVFPTLACNFKCVYCYQAQYTFQNMLKHTQNITMNDEVKNGLIRYVEGRADKLRSLHVDYMGGEPTVAMDTMVELSTAMKDMCERDECVFTSGLVTNGYALDEAAAIRLKQAGLDSALITVDGPPDVHNVRRPLKSGKGTFDVVLNNVKAVADIFDRVIIRMNVDKTNYESVPAFLDILEEHGLKEKIRILFIALEYDTREQAGVSQMCWAASEYSDREIELSETGLSKGFKVLNLLKANPRAANRLCSAVKKNFFVIDPSGNIYKCLGEVGDVRFTEGRIDGEGRLHTNYNAVEWLGWSAFDNEDCRNCPVFPICRGGCMFTDVLTRIKGEGNVVMKSGRCATVRSNLPKMLELYYRAIMKERNGRKEHAMASGGHDE